MFSLKSSFLDKNRSSTKKTRESLMPCDSRSTYVCLPWGEAPWAPNLSATSQWKLLNEIEMINLENERWGGGKGKKGRSQHTSNRDIWQRRHLSLEKETQAHMLYTIKIWKTLYLTVIPTEVIITYTLKYIKVYLKIQLASKVTPVQSRT